MEAVAARWVKEHEAVDGEVTFECLPVYHLEEKDLVAVEQPSWAMQFRWQKATIPLGPGLMSVGVVRNLRGKAVRR